MDISLFDYELPDDRIAQFPVSPRDGSKLLVYRSGTIRHHHFHELPELLPKDSVLVLNDSKVIPARLVFEKQTGARIEVFCLAPVNPVDVQQAMTSTNSCVWHCMVGNLKRFKPGETLQKIILSDGKEDVLSASIILSEEGKVHIRFAWNSGLEFARILDLAGRIPLPPYLNREAGEKDITDYQTTYAKQQGAVAAPTAGLHFTSKTFIDLSNRGIETRFLTLHVGAGTFLPVKVEDVKEHPMHAEKFEIERDVLVELAEVTGKMIPVGTTALRTLETLYWLAVMMEQEPELLPENLFLPKLLMYSLNDYKLKQNAFETIVHYMDKWKLTKLVGRTEMMIMPGYQYKICSGIVTNFHQPRSTLLMLIAAMIGDDWKEVYEQAMLNDYRFLSFGDSSLLLP